ncbi:hypothetical protein B0T22DRAFT_466995 [Podospora appendiculata]|uniref:Signal recognition particle subunit SRP72 n=1 Tax=Podospora appendiculata TaxID=314037 RepID=A0AAE0X6G2_9PEZI|nr:hypothetical protein B0T22DRAFT_466995 [Podospora appendiculata]
MADPAVAALNSLLRGTSIDDHAVALKLANAAIKASKAKGSNSSSNPDLPTAQHTRIVALLKLDRYADALRAIAEGGAALDKTCVLEKAYALYKTGDLDGAEAVLQTAGPAEHRRGLKHVAAQVAYRAEKSEQAAAIYRELATVEDGARYGEENDLRINLLATNAQLEWQGKGWAVPDDQKKPAREELEAFETAYNAACGCISRGDFAKATVLLKRSRNLCEASEDLSDDEKKAELVPIIVQQAYVCIKLGKLDEATSLHKSIVLSEVSDASTKAIAQSNILVLQAETNPFMAQRLAQAMPEIVGNDRLFGYQTSIFKRNKYIIDLQAQKFAGVERKTSALLAQDPVPSISSTKCELGVLNAAAACQLQTGKDALKQTLPLLEKRPNDVGLLLTIIQLYLQLQNPTPALYLLEAFFKRLEVANTPDHADVRFAPGLVALAVALYHKQGRHGAARTELAKAAAHWQQRGASAAAGSGNPLVREAGIGLLHSSHPSDLAAAGNAFTYLVAAQPSDPTATAGLVASFATTDFAKAKPYLDNLAPVDKLIAGIDAEALLEAGVAVLPVAPAQSKKRALDEPGQEKQPQPAAKKRRRQKLPKNFDPTKKPDPERWLPLRDRSSYRPKGKKGKKRVADSTQGGAVREEETLELAGGAGSVKVEKAPAGGGGGGGGGGGAGAKKKKKGKK